VIGGKRSDQIRPKPQASHYRRHTSTPRPKLKEKNRKRSVLFL